MSVQKHYDPNNNVYGWQYDNMGRVLEADYPDGTKESWTYYSYGPKQTFTNRNGDVETFTYDPRNRLTGKSWSTGLSTTYTLDDAGYTTGVSNYASQVTLKRYNDHRLQYDIQQVQEGSWVNNQCTVSYVYNPDSLVKQEQVLEGTGIEATLTYKYTPLDQLSTLDVTGAFLPGTIEADYAYNLRGDVKEKNLSTGAYTGYQYDSDDQIQTITDYEAKDTDAVLQSSYKVDEKGRIQTITHAQTGATLQFKYDPDDRLTTYSNPGGQATETSGLTALIGVEPPATANSYTPDAADNWTNLTINGTSTNFVPNNLNQYATIGTLTPTYDKNGNLTSYNGWSFIYDAENHLRTVSGPSTAIQYDYDGLGRCVVQTVNGVAQFNVYDHWKMVMAINTSGNIVVQNVYGPGHDSLICTGKSGVSSPYFYHQDHNGSITGISDSSGIMRETVMYDPYGRPYMFDRNGNPLSKSAFANSFYFAGRPYTPLTGWNSGIYDMRHRFYAADIGRFIQGDPIGFKGGGNLYAYSGNNPVSRTDTSGLEDLSLFGGGSGGGGGDTGYTGLAPNPSYNPTDPANGPGGWEWSVTSLTGNYSWASPYNVVSADTSSYYDSGYTTSQSSGGVLSGGYSGSDAGYYDSAGNQSSSTIGSVLTGALDLVGKIWNIPNDIIGLTVGLASLPFGAQINGFGDNALQFINMPFSGAVTFGNVELFGSDSPPSQNGYYYGVYQNSGLHEEGHTFQSELLGPFFLPSYVPFGIANPNNPFERGAIRFATGGGSWFPY